MLSTHAPSTLAGRCSQVGSELDELEAATHALLTVAENLVSRIASVTRNEPAVPVGVEKEKAPKPLAVPLAEAICSIRRRIQAVTDILASATERCEL